MVNSQFHEGNWQPGQAARNTPRNRYENETDVIIYHWHNDLELLTGLNVPVPNPAIKISSFLPDHFIGLVCVHQERVLRNE